MAVASIESVDTYLVFLLANELYAIENDKIREIKVGYRKSIHPISNFNPLLAGEIDSGATKIPVLDISSTIPSLKKSNKLDYNAIIIIETVVNKQKKKCGLLIDSVLNTININSQNILTTSFFNTYVKKVFVSKEFSGCNETIKILNTNALLENTG